MRSHRKFSACFFSHCHNIYDPVEPRVISSVKKERNEQAYRMIIPLPRYTGSPVFVIFDANKGQGAGGSLATHFVEISLQQAWSWVLLPCRGSAERCLESQPGRRAGRQFLLAGDVPAAYCSWQSQCPARDLLISCQDISAEISAPGGKPFSKDMRDSEKSMPLIQRYFWRWSF